MSRTNLSFRDDIHRLLDGFAAGNEIESTILARGVVLARGLDFFANAHTNGDLKGLDAAVELCRTDYKVIHDSGNERSGGVDISSVASSVLTRFQTRYGLPKKSTAYRILMVIGLSSYDFTSVSSAGISQESLDLLQKVKSALEI